ncbi:MAG: hypothetical protein ABGY29_04980 [bacterium]
MIGVDQKILNGGWSWENALASDEYGVSIAAKARKGEPLSRPGGC